jgi:hypothetical protein
VQHRGDPLLFPFEGQHHSQRVQDVGRARLVHLLVIGLNGDGDGASQGRNGSSPLRSYS